MIETRFTFNSEEDGLKLNGFKWLPDDSNLKGVLQIIHGSVEHSARYREYGRWLTERGFGVYIFDQRGHGETAFNQEYLSLFSEDNGGWDMAINDVYQLTKLIKSEYSQLPIFILGHSMGSIEARDFAGRYGNEVDGVMLSGSVSNDFFNITKLQLFLRLIKLNMNKHGKKFRSSFFHSLVYGKLRLSRDLEIEKNYKNDPYCGYTCTLEYLHEMISGIINVSRTTHYSSVPTHLPMYLFSGSKDKVGGLKIKRVYESYKNAGVKDIEFKVYDDAFHEVLNETNKEEVYQDTLDWMNRILVLDV
ncbi:alpha/beta hydrolase [Acidaminobacter sp. JC074]|uniref:alpha/beta hydrolase n=1 Tax=Acidaminobacter sp. JC074 TaxID=2530199 RepID=UPI001F0E1258|nr:alpha/beta fold hydrolase [Acidaminobacter sp. JC074]MCH4891112.1 alpha/beta hydrolase [Acidaminobacter sp. JC074]